MEKKSAANNNWVVKCPKCGKQYHLCEIALPGELLGKPRNHGIIKDPTGTIIYIDWEEQPTTLFEFTCDECDTDFNVEVQLVAKVLPKPEEEDFNNLETSLI